MRTRGPLHRRHRSGCLHINRYSNANQLTSTTPKIQRGERRVGLERIRKFPKVFQRPTYAGHLQLSLAVGAPDGDGLFSRTNHHASHVRSREPIGKLTIIGSYFASRPGLACARRHMVGNQYMAIF